MAFYYWNSGLSWEQYLQTNAFVKDMTGAIRKSGKETRQAISAQTRQIVASDEALTKTFQQGFEQVNSTLADGFGMVGQRLDAVNQGIEQLGAAFEWGMSLLAEQLAVQNQLLTGILEKLDAIHHTLQTPTLTQAREFYNIGRDRLSKGLLDKALAAFLQAEAKNDTDFLTQSALGHLYLYGLNEDCNVIDLAKAEQHFRNAARYAKPEIQHLPEARKYCGEAYLHASIACYAQAHERQQDNDKEQAQRLLRDAATLAKQATDIYPQLSEAFYQRAKVQALLGDAPPALTSLVQAVKADRNYCLKADVDHDFDAIRPQVFAAFEQLRQQAQADAQNAINETRRLLDEYVFLSEEAKQIQHEFIMLINQSAKLFSKGTYFDYLDILTYPDHAQASIRRILVPSELVARLIGHRGSISCVTFSPDGRYLASSGDDGTVRLWEVLSGTLVTTLREEDVMSWVSSIVFSPDGRYLASGTYMAVRLWDISSGKVVMTLEHTGAVTSVAFSPDGRYLASAINHSVCLWDMSSGKEIATLTGHTDDISSVTFSPDGRHIASAGGFDKTIRLWEYASGRAITVLQDNGKGRIYSIAFSPDGRYLSSGWGDPKSSDDSTIKLWDISSKQLIAILPGHKHVIYSVAFSSDGCYIASGSYDNTIRLWEHISGKCIAILQEHSECVCSVAFSLNGDYLASGSEDGSVRIWGQRHLMSKRAFELQEQARRQEEERQRRAGEEERQRREQADARQRAEQLRADRRRQGLCETCGAALGFFDKLNGQTKCKKCR